MAFIPIANTQIYQGLLYYYGLDGSDPADAAQFRANVLNDLVNGTPIWPGAFEAGQLYVPNRGVLRILPGDVIAYDPTGWPILLSAASYAQSWGPP